MENNIEETADKLIANYLDDGNLKNRFEKIDDIESVLNKSNTHPYPFSFYIDELNGCLGYMYYIYCNWQSDSSTTSLITADITDYNKGFKDFTVQLLKLLHERTENEKKVTNNEWIKN